MKIINSELKVKSSEKLDKEIEIEVSKANISDEDGKKIIEGLLNGTTCETDGTRNCGCDKKGKSKIKK